MVFCYVNPVLCLRVYFDPVKQWKIVKYTTN
jgi:hypothetical protein